MLLNIFVFLQVTWHMPAHWPDAGSFNCQETVTDMYRTHTCGELRIADIGKTVTLAGWVQKSRKLGGMTFIDLRDRYGITQLVVDAAAETSLMETAGSLGREYVIQATGTVVERQSKNL